MAEDEITALKQSLCNQLLVMKRLYAELEEEREASASGVDEALTMILRLQKEKAEEKMEACQFKQMAESKMHHAEESLAMLEQVICQKDIEIASLKHQVQAYIQMLLSAGGNNADVLKLNENRWFSSSAFLKRTSSSVQVRRQTSMPSIRFSKLCSEIAINEGDCPLLPALQSICREIGDNQNQLKEHQCVCEKTVVKESNSDANQVQEVSISAERLLEKSVEQKVVYRTVSANNQFQINMTIGPQMSFEEDFTPCSWHSAASSDMLSSSCLEAESIGNTIQYVSPQHMFEIPKSNNGCILRTSSKVLQEPHWESEQMSGIPESVPEETAYYSLGDDDFSKEALKLPTIWTGTSMNYRPNFFEPSVRAVSFRTDVEQLKCQVQQIVDDIRIMKQEDLKKDKEQVKLLRKMHEQLKPVQSHPRRSKANKFSPQDEALFVYLTEAMLSFSL